MRRRLTTALAALAAVVACTLAGPATAQAAEHTTAHAALTKPKTITGKALLGKLTVRAEHTKGYKRAKFQYPSDADGDCQDTRAEVLQQESRVPVIFSSTTRPCWVDTGKWVSWYDDKTWTDDDDVEIDHVVALSEAWKSGAWKWKSARLSHYGNDLAFRWTLEAVTSKVNQTKSDDDPAEWLPIKSARCTYARHWVAIKYRWKLSIDTTEKKALSKILTGSCGKLKMTIPARAS